MLVNTVRRQIVRTLAADRSTVRPRTTPDSAAYPTTQLHIQPPTGRHKSQAASTPTATTPPSTPPPSKTPSTTPTITQKPVMAGKKKKLSKKQKATQAAASPRDQYSTAITASTGAPTNSNKSSEPTKKKKNLQEQARILAEWEAGIAWSKARAGADPTTIAGAAGGRIATQERGVRQPTTATSKMNPGSQTSTRASPSVQEHRDQCRKGHVGEAITGPGKSSAPHVLTKHNPVKENATKQSRIVITADRAATQNAVKVKGTRHILIRPDKGGKQTPVKEKGLKDPGIVISPNQSAKPKPVQEKPTKQSDIPVTDQGSKQNAVKQKRTKELGILIFPNKSVKPKPVKEKATKLSGIPVTDYGAKQSAAKEKATTQYHGKVKGTKQPAISVTPKKGAKQNPVTEKGTKQSGTKQSGTLITPVQDAAVKPGHHTLDQIPPTKSSVLTIGPKTVHCTPLSAVGAAPLAGGVDQFAASAVHDRHPDEGEKIHAPLRKKNKSSGKQLPPLVQHVVADQPIIGHQHPQTLGCTTETPGTTSGCPPSSSAREHGTQYAQIVGSLPKKNKALQKQIPPPTYSPQLDRSVTGTHAPELRDGRTQVPLKLLQPTSNSGLSIVEKAMQEAGQRMAYSSRPRIPTARASQLAKAIAEPTPVEDKLQLVTPQDGNLAAPVSRKRRKKGNTASRFAMKVLLAIVRGGVPLLFTDLVSLLPL